MKTQTLGPIEIRKLTEIDRLEVDAYWLLKNLTKDFLDTHRAELGSEYVHPTQDRVFLSFHTFVVQTPHHNILIDTCNGNDKQRPSMPVWHMMKTPYLENLAAMGLRPEDIDMVMCTHLHTDHVGWNTRLENGRWVPTFPKARYFMSRVDFEVFNAQHRDNPKEPVNRGSFADSVLPVVEHGQAVFVDPGDVVSADLADNVWLEDAVGHSPGNMNINITGGGRSACICGDTIHHPLQCADPNLHNTYDYDTPQGVVSRRKLLERCADTDTILLTGHFRDPTAGRVISHPGGGFRFRFEDR